MTQPSQRERIAQYIQDRYAVEPEYLWTRYPNYAVFRQPASRKWFAAIMDVAQKSLDLPGDGTASWISVLMDETLPDEDIYPLLELSYDSVAPKRKKG